MRGIDITIGVVIILAVLLSGIGVATYESAPQENDYNVTWSTDSQALSAPPGTRTGNGDVNVDIPIDFDNITEVTIDVRVQGNGPRPTAVTARATLTPVNATAPPAQTINLQASPQGGAGTTQFVVQVQGLPAVASASGSDENATYEELNQEERTETGSGIWKLVVTISGSTAGPVGVGAETFTVTTTGQVKTYKPTLAPATPDINR